jgi:hypothetical protein
MQNDKMLIYTVGMQFFFFANRANIGRKKPPESVDSKNARDYPVMGM